MIFKNCFTYFKHNSFITAVCLCSFIIGCFHLWQFFLSDFNYNCLIRLLFFYAVIPIVLIFGKKSVYYMLIYFSLSISYVNQFNNYTGFFCILMSCKMIGKKHLFLLCVYFFNEFFALTVQESSASHYAIHFSSCILWYILYFYISNSKIELQLTNDEIKILNALIDGKQQKEIDFFNKNTVTKKLAEARKKNNCKTTNELLYKYRKTLEKKGF